MEREELALDENDLIENKIDKLEFEGETIIIEDFKQIEEFQNGTLTSPKEISVFFGYKDLRDSDMEKIISSFKGKEKFVKEISLNLMKNDFTETAFTNLFKFLTDLEKLTSLTIDLRSNKLGKSYEHLAQSLKKLKNLIGFEINLEESDSDLNTVMAITDTVANFTKLQKLKLNFAEIKLGDEACKNLSQNFNKLTNLYELSLNLCNTEIHKNGIKEMSKGLQKLVNLREFEISFSNSKIEFEGAESLAQTISAYKELELLALNIFSSDISVKGAKVLATSIGELERLNMLGIMINESNISSEGCKAFCEIVGNLKKLSFFNLNLEKNQMKDEDLTTLTNSLVGLKNCDQINLKLSNNFIGDTSVVYLAQTLETMTQVQSLLIELDYNNLTEKSVNALDQMLLRNINECDTAVISLGGNKIGEDLKKRMKEKHKDKMNF